MKRLLILSLSVLSLAPASEAADKKPNRPEPVEAPATPLPVEQSRSPMEFHDDQLPLVLRTLARQARVNMVIDEKVERMGTVTMRLEKTTPREAIDIIAASKGLLIEAKDGVLHVRPADPSAIPEAPAFSGALDEAMLGMFGPILIKMHDAVLDHLARPETAKKIAKAKKVLFDALLAEGFTREEAFKLVLADQGTTVPNFGGD